MLDAFCGSGTAMVASMMLERRWIGIDKSEDAIKTSQARINEQDKKTGGLFTTISQPAKNAKKVAIMIKTNTLHQGDNLTIMQSFADCCVDLIYIRPAIQHKAKMGR